MRISKHTIATSKNYNHFIVDSAGIGLKSKLLPGEVSLSMRGFGEKSAEAIVGHGNEPIKTIGIIG
jgi:hypothetical protein